MWPMGHTLGTLPLQRPHKRTLLSFVFIERGFRPLLMSSFEVRQSKDMLNTYQLKIYVNCHAVLIKPKINDTK